MTFTEEQLVLATRVWLAAIRREWLKRHPGETWPHPSWESLTVSERQAFMRPIRAAMEMTDPAKAARMLAAMSQS